MKNTFCQFLTLMRILRLLGVFPYTWQVRKIRVPTATGLRGKSPDPKDEKKITRCIFSVSTSWKIWSVLFALTNFVMLSYSVYRLNSFNKERTMGLVTLRFAYNAYDILLYITLVSAYIYCGKNFKLLGKLVNSGEQFQHKLLVDRDEVWNLGPSFYAPVVVFFVEVGIVIYVTLIENIFFRDIFHMISYMAVAFTNILLVTTLSTTLSAILKLISSLYENVFHHLVKQSEILERKYSKQVLGTDDDMVPLKDKINTIFPHEYYLTESDDETTAEMDEAVDGSLVKTKNYVSFEDIKYCTKNLLQIYSYQRMVIKYFDLLVVKFMLYLIPSAIIGFFYIGLINLSSYEILMPLFYITLSVIPTLCLVNAPYCVCRVREKTRHRIVNLKFSKNMKHLKGELNDLLSLIDEDVGFNFLGIFNLSRARMVDIGSFVATYVVILMQFQTLHIGNLNQTFAGNCSNM